MSNYSSLLDINNLQTQFISNGHIIPAVDGVNIKVQPSETVGIVGESGSGKTVTALSVMRLLPRRGAKIVSGDILFKDQSLLALSEAKMREIRGNEIAMIFQEPMTSLNPVYTVNRQLCEMIMLHRNYNKQEAQAQALTMLKRVNIPRPEKILEEYPHQLSGGMRQRVMIAMAMSCDPSLLIADEPTTALDVTIQAQILDLMRELRQSQQTSILLITHDLGVVAEMCDRVYVMYAGQVVEEADIYALFENPSHPYTQGLLRSMPKANVDLERLDSIPGNVPLPGTVKQGCRFASRCPHTAERCLCEAPPFVELSAGQKSRCWLHAEPTRKEVHLS
ncbi:ABC transporter ATP-binding protein [Desulfosporosinus fructosivorans]|uniref:ABC transporter ATP-binding protein n=1 Tax=Desulfosporosinus fructosivorans TaxID=2018669 RepID=UPI001FB1064C|nr:ABC transporter ATP-binding protein [Desulfosporosinus fructosivorans]